MLLDDVDDLLVLVVSFLNEFDQWLHHSDDLLVLVVSFLNEFEHFDGVIHGKG